MNTTRARGWLLFAFFAVAGCGGGGVQGVGGKGSGGTDGGEEASTGTGFPGDDMLGGDDEIGNDGGSPFDPRCASGNPIGTGLACSGSGLVCPLGTIADCNGGQRTLDCVCEGNTWSCDPVTATPCPPPTACPDPSTVYPGTGCEVPEGQQCLSTNLPGASCGGEPAPPVSGSCACTTGGWACPENLPNCPAQACPGPYSVYANQYCMVPGLTCPGNPQTCGAQVYYDALECEGSYWVDVATTACDVDEVDASADTGALIFDAAPVTEGDSAAVFEGD
jgi:hypothetical protein